MELIIVAGPTAARAPPPSPIRARKPRLLYWEGPATPAPRIPRALAPRSPGDLFARVPSPATTHVTKPSPLAFSLVPALTTWRHQILSPHDHAAGRGGLRAHCAAGEGRVTGWRQGSHPPARAALASVSAPRPVSCSTEAVPARCPPQVVVYAKTPAPQRAKKTLMCFPSEFTEYVFCVNAAGTPLPPGQRPRPA